MHEVLWSILVIDCFSDVKFVFTRIRTKPELFFFASNSVIQIWLCIINILSEGTCRRELCEGIGSEVEMKIVF